MEDLSRILALLSSRCRRGDLKACSGEALAKGIREILSKLSLVSISRESCLEAMADAISIVNDLRPIVSFLGGEIDAKLYSGLRKLLSECRRDPNEINMSLVKEVESEVKELIKLIT